ncbi:MAG: glycosyltransferase family 2 protein [Cytophagales bacterium]|nr:glycosyltransferase family 2 protein [Cytophagales bacterium]
MKVSGFTFIRNAIIYDYPIVEAIQSIMPLCDEVVVAVGKSDDNTRELIENINSSKIKIIDTVWDDTLRSGGSVLAVETDKALKAVSSHSDWCVYIQGDEVLHEKYINTVTNAMNKYANDSNIDGLLFKYLHFYGSYDYVGASPRWYPYEIRVVKNNPAIHSYKDAMGFRKNGNTKLNVKLIDAYIYHYGWVKMPAAMQKKQENFNKYWHQDDWVDKNVAKTPQFEYDKNIDSLTPFQDTHPQVMLQRIAQKNWHFDHDISMNKFTPKEIIKIWLKRYTGIEIGYKNYIIV